MTDLDDPNYVHVEVKIDERDVEIAALKQALASITRERDEAREISRVMMKFYPFGQVLHRDEKLCDALLAVQSPSVRTALVNGEGG